MIAPVDQIQEFQDWNYNVTNTLITTPVLEPVNNNYYSNIPTVVSFEESPVGAVSNNIDTTVIKTPIVETSTTTKEILEPAVLVSAASTLATNAGGTPIETKVGGTISSNKIALFIGLTAAAYGIYYLLNNKKY